MNIHKHEYLLQQVNKLKNKKFEIAILTQLLYDVDLLITIPYTQYPVNNYYIDLYYPDLKIAIEIDENHHRNQTDYDLNRQNIITQKLNCTFLRYKIEDIKDCIDTKESIKSILFEKINSLQEQESFRSWDPKEFDLTTAQQDWPNAIFLKIKEPDEINFRKPISISHDKLQNANLLVGIYGKTVTEVLKATPECWEKQDNGRYSNIGNAIPNHPLNASGNTTWNITSNKAFGNNLR